MTSFNHYALGSIVSFLHKYVGGISILEPGWKKCLIRPVPGGTLTSADIYHISPYGRISCSWVLKGEELKVDIEVPPNSSARVLLPGIDEEVGSGKRSYTVKWEQSKTWPPKVVQKVPHRLRKDVIVE
jgi:alpha-L-rhamnosidase